MNEVGEPFSVDVSFEVVADEIEVPEEFLLRLHLDGLLDLGEGEVVAIGEVEAHHEEVAEILNHVQDVAGFWRGINLAFLHVGEEAYGLDLEDVVAVDLACGGSLFY